MLNLGTRFATAFQMALRLHQRQHRKGTEVPYISHLMAVAAIALENGANEDQTIAALLHDAAEDQGGAPILIQIEQHFGPEVARIVLGCTDNMGSEKLSWRSRKEAYLTHLTMAPDDVRLVCAADKLHNVRCLLVDLRHDGEPTWERFAGKKDGTLWYYRAITDIFLKLGPERIAVELDLVVGELQRLAGEHSKTTA
jgi:(p)ppGpp synthase/HD superfamily hydrolase